MKNIILLFILLIPAFLFAQYPATGNKQRLGYQTTGDGLIWRGVAADTVNKPNNRNYPYFQLDTVNAVLYRFIQTKQQWQPVTGGTDIDSLIYATRYWVSTNFFPLIGGTLTGTGGAGFIGFPSQVSAPGTPASGLNVYAQGSSFNWKGTDGYERQFASTITGGRTYTLPDVSGTFALGTGTTNRVPLWTATNTLGNSNIQDNGTAISILNSKPFALGQWTTAGRPTGVNGYTGFNTSFNWLDIYSSSGWFSPARAATTGGAFTAGYIPFGGTGGLTESQYLTYTGTRFQTGGTIRFARNNSLTDTAQIEKTTDGNSKIVRINNPGDVGGWNGGLVFRGGTNGVLATVGTFRIYTNSSTAPGSVYVGNVSEGGAQTANPTTNLGVLNKITSTNVYDTGVNLNPGGTSPNNFSAYSLTNGKHFGFFIGGQGGTNQLQSMSDVGYGVYAGFQYQPLTNGYGSSWVFVAKNDASTATEILRLQGKDGNICLGCTNAQYKLYTTSTDAYGLPRGTVAQRPTIISSTTPLRFNTDSTALEYGESVGTWRQIATRAYARSLVSGLGAGTVTSVGLSLPSIFSVSGSPVTTSGTLSATFTGGTSDLFLRGDGRWMKSLYFNSSDSLTFNASAGALIRVDGTSGSFNSRFEVFDYGYLNNTLAIATDDDARYNFDRSRGTVAIPTALLKNDRIGGIYFRAHNGSSYRKAGYIGAVVDSIHSGANPQSKLIFGTSEVNSPETSSYWRFLIESMRNISVVDHVTGASMGVGFGSSITVLESATVDARFHVKGAGTTTGKTMLLEDSGGADILTITDNKTIQAHGYGTGTKEAADLSKTQSNYIAGFATDGTVLDLERKRDTTIFVTADTDYDFSAAVTTAQIANRYNRVIIHMTLTSGVGADKTTTLHTPDANLMQCEILIRGTDNTGTYDNEINFGTSNAISSDGTNTSGYTLAQGQGLHVRVVYNGSAYKYIYY